MATHEYFNMDPFWDDEFKTLQYKKEQFNDPVTMIDWEDRGFRGPFGGHMCDMRSPQPSWNKHVISFFHALNWKNIGTSYYRMDPGSVLPTHVDLYSRYIHLFNLRGQENKIKRAVIFLEDWQSGHYAECCDKPYTEWIKGFTLIWSWDAPHMAANLGTVPRYTLQVTGHI